ncbi:hypothetical protein AKO1_005288 [Acrasis kona]|uniref:BRCT domain-containing protein n=1 Tax=Acrasis kona TaxID=1008807 RepID=A0AAW2YKH4_9EUKA
MFIGRRLDVIRAFNEVTGSTENTELNREETNDAISVDISDSTFRGKKEVEVSVKSNLFQGLQVSIIGFPNKHKIITLLKEHSCGVHLKNAKSKDNFVVTHQHYLYDERNRPEIEQIIRWNVPIVGHQFFEESARKGVIVDFTKHLLVEEQYEENIYKEVKQQRSNLKRMSRDWGDLEELEEEAWGKKKKKGRSYRGYRLQ